MPISAYIKRIRARIGNELLLVPGVTAVVVNQREEALLQLRRDSQTWAPPSGSVEPGETVADAAIREVYEETGVTVQLQRVVAVLSGAEYQTTYPNGDQLASVTTVFRCAPRDDSPPRVNDDESLEIRYFAIDALPEKMLPRHRWMIRLALENRAQVYFDSPSA